MSSPISGEIIENEKDKKGEIRKGRHKVVDIKIGNIYKNSEIEWLRLEIQSFLEYSISAFYTARYLCPF